MSAIEDAFAFQLAAAGIEYWREYKACPPRRFRWDFAIASRGNGIILVEIQGGIWRAKGAHNTGKAIQRDCHKNNLAVSNGFRVLYFTPDMVESGEALATVEEVLK